MIKLKTTFANRKDKPRIERVICDEWLKSEHFGEVLKLTGKQLESYTEEKDRLVMEGKYSPACCHIFAHIKATQLDPLVESIKNL